VIEESISVIRGRPHHVGAIGTIETMERTPHDRPVVGNALRDSSGRELERARW
jgi:hypothetical protein